MDYYFTLGIEGTFKIHRISRTRDFEIVDEVLHWELPSIYDIDDVDEDCISTHDCPYLHLHQDGVMVLNWIDGGWNEKNIKRCYNFDTDDVL